ncbi:MAG TPA: hypothetical protein VIY53_21015 [Acidobacteriaceae bacterium]
MALAASLPSVKERRLRVAAIPVFWHLLSLDAPTVAVLWAWSFARPLHVGASAASLAVLGIGTWLVYIGDRLLDGRAGADRTELQDRHLFHARHRRPLLMTGVAASGALLAAIAKMPAAARREDALLFGITALYFLAAHRPQLRSRFPREAVVGIVVACACAVPAWSQATATHAELCWLVPLLAALCWLNCRAIHVWERPEPAAHRSVVSIAALTLAAMAATFMFVTANPGALRLAAAVAASALLLFALDRDRRRALNKQLPALSPLALRILADAVLLTPLLLLVPWRL